MLRSIIFFIVAATQFTFAQITITSTDLLNLIDINQVVEYDTSYTIPVDVGTAGPDQTWNFTDVPTTMENSSSIISPQGTPFENSFPNANFVHFIDFSDGDTLMQIYSYTNITSSAFLIMGEGIITKVPNVGDTSFTTIDDEETPLPLTYGLEWNSMDSDTTSNIGFTIITTTNSNYSIDAWGTVTVPAGTFECLRLREDYTSKSMMVFDEITIPIDSSSGINYTWLSKDNYSIANIESQSGEKNPEFTQSSYFMRLKSSSIPTAISENQNSVFINQFTLEQNYPNPFNPATAITYTIGKAGYVKLSIYDSAGRLVQTLINQYQNSGKYSIRWNASGLASGIYYYRIQTPRFTEMKKAALLK